MLLHFTIGYAKLISDDTGNVRLAGEDSLRVRRSLFLGGLDE